MCPETPALKCHLAALACLWAVHARLTRTYYLHTYVICSPFSLLLSDTLPGAGLLALFGHVARLRHGFSLGVEVT